jgi:hypothetical protein
LATQTWRRRRPDQRDFAQSARTAFDSARGERNRRVFAADRPDDRAHFAFAGRRQAATGARPRSTPTARHWPPASRRSIEMAISASSAPRSARDSPRAQAAEKGYARRRSFSVFSPESVSAVILLLKQRQAKLEAADRRFFIFCDLFFIRGSSVSRSALAELPQGARRSAKRFECEPVFPAGRRRDRRDVPIIGARLQALDHVAPAVFQHADCSMSPKLARSTTLSFAAKIDESVAEPRAAHRAVVPANYETSVETVVMARLRASIR